MTTAELRRRAEILSASLTSLEGFRDRTSNAPLPQLDGALVEVRKLRRDYNALEREAFWSGRTSEFAAAVRRYAR